MALYDFIKTKDSQLADTAAADPHYFSLSPTRVSLAKKIFPCIKKHINGLCLDAGAGRMAYRPHLADSARQVVSMDMKIRAGLDLAGSVLNVPVQDQTFDSVFCSQVLEHVPLPEQALKEFFRCLKPGGALVLSVPHLAYLHNEPHDYFRYTKHGLWVMLERAGFTEIEVEAAGGLLSFLGHIPSVILKAVFSPIPLIGPAVLAANRVYSKIVSYLDDKVDKKKLFALNYVVVARKPAV